MFYPDHDTRRQLTTEKMERLADDYTRANGHGARRHGTMRMPLDLALELARRAQQWATALQPET